MASVKTKGGIFHHERKVTLREEDHRYFDQDGIEFMSQSKFWSQFKPAFPEDMQFRSAGKQLREAGETVTAESIQKRGNELKSQWNSWTKDSQDHGTIIHNELEKYGKGMSLMHPSFKEMCDYVYRDHLLKHQWWNEQVFFLEDDLIAGTCDRVAARTNSTRSIIDIDDYKTNQRRGIEFEDKYGKRMIGPLSHLENCNYNHYSLQDSTYAYMVEKTFGLKIGNLGIWYIKGVLEKVKEIHILKDWSAVRYPVPYMKLEVEAAIEYHREHFAKKPVNLKPLPLVTSANNILDPWS